MKYIIDRVRFVRSRAPFPDEESIKMVILENNDKFIAERDGGFPVIYCDNKPRNMPIYGLFWVEETAVIDTVS